MAWNNADDLIKALEGMVQAPKIAPQTKILLIALAIDGRSMSAEKLAEWTALTPNQVHHWLRGSVEAGAVRRAKRPDYEREEFVTTYAIVTPQEPESGLEEFAEPEVSE